MSFLVDFVIDNLLYKAFSHNDVCEQKARMALEARYSSLFVQDKRFNRKLVSFQANKGKFIHGWIKYKEGFSAQLVETLINDFAIQPGERILDPFAGSATTLLVAKTKGINADGIEILPNCHLSWEAKSRFKNYDLNELKKISYLIQQAEPKKINKTFPHVTITESAFSPEVERDIMFFTSFLDSLEISNDAKILLRLIVTSILEEVSYTRKDGQYLRWDYRSNKVRERNEIRIIQGKAPIKKIDKGKLPSVKETLTKALKAIIDDIIVLQHLNIDKDSEQRLINGSTLEILPTLQDNIYSGVITSPPYVNRYDYTRTYALELAYLGVGKNINQLRQRLLSCTVESKSKASYLHDYYENLGMLGRYEFIREIVQSNPVFIEINNALITRWNRGDMNNKGVLPMVSQYFTELTFVFAELYRICRHGANVAFVNDNTRYGGEIIPVDTLTTNLAESLGFQPMAIYVLPQKKGNSSQQMEKFGREELRKSITIWKKP
jgi:site-specific DNA-methyltransferase (cytosine-N4-specific)